MDDHPTTRPATTRTSSGSHRNRSLSNTAYPRAMTCSAVVTARDLDDATAIGASAGNWSTHPA